MAKVNYSPASLRDLEEIGDYIAKELKNPTAALTTVNRIQDSIDKLEDAPRIGMLLSAHYECAGDYRFLVCGSYLAFYREQDNKVYVDRILYGKRDYIKILFGELSGESIE